ncbi:MAG: tetratricopeptide repeat protein [bacterium]
MVKSKELKSLEKKYQHREEKRYFLPLADAYRKNNDLAKCISLLRQGLSHFPQYWAARVALGRALVERGDLDEAQKELEAARDHVPENLLLHRLLASIYFTKGELRKAAYYCQLVLFVIPHDGECLFIMDEIFKAAGDSKREGGEFKTPSVPEAGGGPQPEAAHMPEAGVEPVLEDKPVPEDEITSAPEYGQSEQALFVQEVPGLNVPEQEPQELAQQEEIIARSSKEDAAEQEEEIVTPTIAELYLAQGVPEKAIEIYQKLLIQQPDHREWQERVNFIQHKSGIMPPVRKTDDCAQGNDRVLQQLETWLKNIEKSTLS